MSQSQTIYCSPEHKTGWMQGQCLRPGPCSRRRDPLGAVGGGGCVDGGVDWSSSESRRRCLIMMMMMMGA